MKGWLKAMKSNRRKMIISLFFLIVALSLYMLSGDYVTDRTGNVTSQDIILDNVPPINLSFLYVWLLIVVIVLGLAYPLIYKPDEIPYVLNMFSFFIVVRSGFIILTHLRTPSDAITVSFPYFLSLLTFSNDLFFSGHAGVPFLFFLIFRKHHKGLSYFMLASSIILGITVLLMHVHYSIDVLSAYFITYGVYKIGNKFMKK